MVLCAALGRYWLIDCQLVRPTNTAQAKQISKENIIYYTNIYLYHIYHDKNITTSAENISTDKVPVYRVSLRYFSDFRLISVLEFGFYFFTCVSESEFRTRFISPLKLYPFRI